MDSDLQSHPPINCNPTGITRGPTGYNETRGSTKIFGVSEALC